MAGRRQRCQIDLSDFFWFFWFFLVFPMVFYNFLPLVRQRQRARVWVSQWPGNKKLGIPGFILENV